MKEPETIEYPEHCPVCDNKKMVITELASKEVEKGVNPRAIPRSLYHFQFVMRDPNYPAIIGSKAPAGNIFIDVCKKCGIVRAIRIEIGEAMAFQIPNKG